MIIMTTNANVFATVDISCILAAILTLKQLINVSKTEIYTSGLLFHTKYRYYKENRHTTRLYNRHCFTYGITM